MRIEKMSIYETFRKGYRKGQEQLLELEKMRESLREELERAEADYREYLIKLIKKYGRGYLTTKKVKEYRYVIWRTPRKDIYLPKELSEKLISLRERIRELRNKEKELRQIEIKICYWLKCIETGFPIVRE